MEELNYSEIIDAGAAEQTQPAQNEALNQVPLYEHMAKQAAYEMQKSGPEPLVLRLRRQKKQAEGEVARLSELITLLAKNPETERILQLLGR